MERKSEVKYGMGEGRRKQETDTEDKTGKKKVMICVIAKKLQGGPIGGRGGKTPESHYGQSYIAEGTGQTTKSPSADVPQVLGWRRSSNCHFTLTYKILPSKVI